MVCVLDHYRAVHPDQTIVVVGLEKLHLGHPSGLGDVVKVKRLVDFLKESVADTDGLVRGIVPCVSLPIVADRGADVLPACDESQIVEADSPVTGCVGKEFSRTHYSRVLRRTHVFRQVAVTSVEIFLGLRLVLERMVQSRDVIRNHVKVIAGCREE